MTVNGFTNLFLLTLERRFHLSSTEVGFIAASNDIAAILLTSLVSFYGAYGNKIKWLGYGSFVTGKRTSHHSLGEATNIVIVIFVVARLRRGFVCSLY